MASSSAAASLGLGDWTQPALAQQVLEAPRAERLAVYARLKDIDVNAACLEVAQLAHVPLALEPKADPAAILALQFPPTTDPGLLRRLQEAQAAAQR